MGNLVNEKRSRNTFVRLSNIDFLLDEFKRIVYEVYGFKIGNRDVFAYCVRNAGYLERVAVSSLAMYADTGYTKKYSIRIEDYEALKKLNTTSSIRNLSVSAILMIMIMSNYSQLLNQRQISVSPTIIKEGRQTAKSLSKAQSSVDTRTHLDFLAGH